MTGRERILKRQVGIDPGQYPDQHRDVLDRHGTSPLFIIGFSYGLLAWRWPTVSMESLGSGLSTQTGKMTAAIVKNSHFAGPADHQRAGSLRLIT